MAGTCCTYRYIHTRLYSIHTSVHSFFFSIIIIIIIFSHCLMVQMQNANAAASRRHECQVSPTLLDPCRLACAREMT